MITKTREVDFFDYLEEFRGDRIKLIKEQNAPVLLAEGPKLIFHLVPPKAFDRHIESMKPSLQLSNSDLEPITPTGWGHARFNFDGRLNSSRDGEKDQAYVQLFRNGIIESVSGFYFYCSNQTPEVSLSALEEEIIKVTPGYLDIERRLGVETPCYITMSLIGVKGFGVAEDRGASWLRGKIDRDDLVLPVMTIDHFDSDAAQVLRPLFDQLWNAVGHPGSPNYGQTGNWKRRR